MENKELKKSVPEALTDQVLDDVSGGTLLPASQVIPFSVDTWLPAISLREYTGEETN